MIGSERIGDYDTAKLEAKHPVPTPEGNLINGLDELLNLTQEMKSVSWEIRATVDGQAPDETRAVTVSGTGPTFGRLSEIRGNLLECAENMVLIRKRVG